jgi:hypothetical protein
MEKVYKTKENMNFIINFHYENINGWNIYIYIYI